MPTKKAAAPAAGVQIIELPRLNTQTLTVTLVGDSPLIMHRWSEKAKREMLDKQMKRARVAKAAKNPEEDYEQSIYRDANGQPCFPATAFKCAAVDACSHLAGITKVQARGAFHVIGEMVPIYGQPAMREDMVRLSGPGGVADIRHRAEFKKWWTGFEVQFNANVLSPAQILNLFATAGFAIGIGEWRPQKDGIYGRFHPATEADLDLMSETAAPPLKVVAND